MESDLHTRSPWPWPDTITINLNVKVTDSGGGSSAQILAALNDLKQQIIQFKGEVMADLASLTAQVAANTSTEASAITLLQGLKTALDAAIASGDPAALQALSDQLGASQTALAAAIIQNTPASTVPPAGGTPGRVR